MKSISILRLRFFGRTIGRTIGLLFKNKRNLRHNSGCELNLPDAYKNKSVATAQMTRILLRISESLQLFRGLDLEN